MRIGFDVSMLVYVGSGVATYTYNLVKNLLLVDKKNEYHLFYSSFRRPKNFYYLDELKKLGAKVHPFRPLRLMKLWWGKWHVFPIEVFTGKMDYFHTSDFLRPPLLKGTVGITTVHDLTWKKFPQWHTKEVREAHERKIRKTLKYKDIIVCPSKTTKRDLLELYPQAKENKIYVIPEGVDERFKPGKDKKLINRVLKKYKIKTPYLIYVGAIEPRKNLKRLIKAFNLLIQKKNYQNYFLVIGGRAGWKNRDVFELVNRLRLQNKVIFTGFVDDNDLPVLYGAAECCCYVSLYEGFGLPPLEAQSCGCPVVASSISSLPEILQDSAVLVDPEKVREIKKGILRCLTDKTLTVRGLRNSRGFSWENTAKSFIKIINEPKN